MTWHSDEVSVSNTDSFASFTGRTNLFLSLAHSWKKGVQEPLSNTTRIYLGGLCTVWRRGGEFRQLTKQMFVLRQRGIVRGEFDLQPSSDPEHPV